MMSQAKQAFLIKFYKLLFAWTSSTEAQELVYAQSKSFGPAAIFELLHRVFTN
jgi:hypothetical protein